MVAEVPRSGRCISAQGDILKDVMDGIASLDSWEWRKAGDVWVQVAAPVRSAYLPTSRRQKMTSRQKLAQSRPNSFSISLQALSARQQNQLGFNGSPRSAGNGVPFSSLPASMQSTVQGLLAASLQGHAGLSGAAPFSASSLGSATIRLQATGSGDGSNSYSVDISNGPSAIGATFTVTADPSEGSRPDTSSDSGLAKMYDSGEAGAPDQEAPPIDARLGTLVTLRMKNATFAEALQQIGLRCGIAFAARLVSNATGQQRKGFKFENVPLKEALDKISSMYHIDSNDKQFHYTWGETDRRIVVFHFVPDAGTPK